MNKETFNLKLLSATALALGIYFMSENLDEPRSEIHNMFPKQSSNNFGNSKLSKFKDLKIQMTNKFPKLKKEVKLDQITVTNAKKKAVSLAEKIEETFVKTPIDTKHPITAYNDTIYYIVFIGILLGIMAYGKTWWENSPEYKSWADQYAAILSGNSLLVTLFIQIWLGIALLIKFYNINKYGGFFFMNNNCNFRLFESKKIPMIATIIIMIFILSSLLALSSKDLKNEQEQDKSTKIPILFIIFILIALSWLFWGGMYTAKNTFGYWKMELYDKLSIASLLLITLSTFLSWAF